LVLFLLIAGIILGPGCLSAREGGIPVADTRPASPQIMTTATSPWPTVTSTSPRYTGTTATPVQLSNPPETPLPTPPRPVDPIVGTWYAPSPDDLTFEFYPDGTFIERSPNFATYRGTWRISEEGEKDFYDADILDRWGYRKQAHLLYSSGSLFTKGIGTMHRIA
jgi:hypothetical protein